jgi:hypothetical protein
MAVSPSSYRSAPYDPIIAQTICDRLAAGEMLRKICKSPGYPAESTVRMWVLDDTAGFATLYARARNIWFDVVAEDTIAISDTPKKGKKTETKEVGRECSLCGKDLRWLSGWKHSEDRSVMCEGAIAKKVFEEKVTTGDTVERARLQVDTRKWLLAKLRPDRYGDRSTLDLSVTGTLNLADALNSRRQKREEQEP